MSKDKETYEAREYSYAVGLLAMLVEFFAFAYISHQYEGGFDRWAQDSPFLLGIFLIAWAAMFRFSYWLGVERFKPPEDGVKEES